MKRLLYQLSYSAEMVVPARLERATSTVSAWCSNQLSYETVWWLRAGLNRRHTDFQSVALPAELQSHKWPRQLELNQQPRA